MRTCSFCKTELELNEENFAYKYRDKGVFSHHCRACQKEYRKKHYEANKQKYIDKAKVWTNNSKREVYEYLLAHPCVDCGQSHPATLDFDHVIEGKVMAVSQMIGRVGRDKIWEEIAKCEVRCANCHRVKTAEDFGWYNF